MKLVCIEALGRSVSSIGFGCASLGGRIGVRRGIEALERGYEAGITWYDVAPSYGDDHRSARVAAREYVTGTAAIIDACGADPIQTDAGWNVTRQKNTRAVPNPIKEIPAYDEFALRQIGRQAASVLAFDLGQICIQEAR